MFFGHPAIVLSMHESYGLAHPEFPRCREDAQQLVEQAKQSVQTPSPSPSPAANNTLLRNQQDFETLGAQNLLAVGKWMNLVPSCTAQRVGSIAHPLFFAGRSQQVARTVRPNSGPIHHHSMHEAGNHFHYCGMRGYPSNFGPSTGAAPETRKLLRHYPATGMAGGFCSNVTANYPKNPQRLEPSLSLETQSSTISLPPPRQGHFGGILAVPADAGNWRPRT